MKTKANVEEFNQDVRMIGGYRYTNSASDVAKHFSNSRTSKAIAQSANFAGKTVLDVGCGDGTFTLELAALGAASVYGIDPAFEAVEMARERAKTSGLDDIVRFDVFNIYDLGAAFGRFDIAVIRGVLHHLDAPKAALKAVASVCDEVVIMEPNGCNPVLKIIERLSPYHVQHEERSFLPMTIDSWLRVAGKTPVEREIINLVPLFCHPTLARILKRLEPVVESIPLVRLFGCGQYIVKAN